jgi:ABC-2 type transport system ATP-binding protein
MVTSAVVIENLHKAYGTVRAVDGVDLSIEPGEIFGILGPNGSGKTTLVECTYGLRRADAGRIQVFGVDAQADPDAVGRLVGAQLQESALPDKLKVGEAIHLFAALGGHRVDEAGLIEQWGLAPKRRASYGSLSGGQRQRLHVALALVARPRLVVLDEMTTGLDPNARREVWQLIDQVRGEGTTVLLVTHFMDEAQRLCDRVAVMAAGRIIARGTPSQLVSAYGGGTVVRFRVTQPSTLPDLSRVPGVLDVGRRDGRVEVRGNGPFLVGLGHALTCSGMSDVELAVEQPSLEDAYVRLVDGGPETAGVGEET